MKVIDSVKVCVKHNVKRIVMNGIWDSVSSPVWEATWRPIKANVAGPVWGYLGMSIRASVESRINEVV